MIDQEYGINTNPYPPGNLQANATIERIHQILGNPILSLNLHDTYVDDADPWMRILEAADFALRYTYHQTKQNIPGQLSFGQDTILPINHLAN